MMHSAPARACCLFLLGLLSVVVFARPVDADLVWENHFGASQPINDGDVLSLPTNTVRFQTMVFSDNDGGTFDLGFGADPGFFYVNPTGVLGNHSGYLALRFDNENNDPADFLQLTLSFRYPVTNLTMQLLDLDAGGAGVVWDDGVEVWVDGVNIKSLPGSFSIGSAVFLDNESYMDGFEGGTTAVPSTGTAGNVAINLGSRPVQSLQIRYFSTDDAAANPGAQILGLSDLSFVSIPEAKFSTTIILAMVLGAIALRRARQSKSAG